MPGSTRRSKAAAAATPRFSPSLNNISQDISNLRLSGPQAPEQHRLWFLSADLPSPPHSQEGSSHSRKKPPNHIPRPSNAYILFRSHFVHQGVLPEGIAFYANSNRVSLIVGQIWNALPDEEKARFYAIGDEEKRLHQALSPEHEITASNRKTKGKTRDESNMTPVQVTCKRIAEMILQNIRGEELVTQIRDVVGWFDQASLSALSREKNTKDGDTDFARIAPISKAKPARKSNKGHTNKPQSPSKARSSSSKQKQSKAATKSPRALVFNPSRLESFVSDNERSGDLTTDPNASYTSSEAGLPLASITGGFSTEGSVDTDLHIPFRLRNPFPTGDAMGDFLSWDEDVDPQGVPFDQGVPFKAIDECPTYEEQYPDGLHDVYFMNQFVRHEAQRGSRYEATQVPIGGLFTGNPVASPEPQTISPQCLF